ncbi:MAG: hypothetical protein GY832_18555 [Chloroflexi bacterium]|nr:hypothetical protein [Chloroflexota bacterium]
MPHYIQRAALGTIVIALLITACAPQKNDLTTISPTLDADSPTHVSADEATVELGTPIGELTKEPLATDTGRVIVTLVDPPPPSDLALDVYIINVNDGAYYYDAMSVTEGVSQLAFEVSPGNYQTYAFAQLRDTRVWHYGYWQPDGGLQTFAVTGGAEHTEPILTAPSDPCLPEFYVPASPDAKYPAPDTDWYQQQLSCPYEAADLDLNGWYRLEIIGGGDAYALETYSQGDTPVVMVPVASSIDAQAWKITPAGDGYYRLTNRSLGEQWSLGIVEENSPFMVSTAANERQYWQIRPSGDVPDFYRLVNIFQHGSSPGAGMPAADDEASGGLWRLTPVDTQTTAIEPTSTLPEGMVRRIESPDLRMVAFSPDGATIAASSGGSEANFAVHVWRTTDGALLHTLDQYTGIVWEIAFSPDGQMLTSASSGEERQLHVWRLSDGALLQSLGAPGATAISVAFSPDGRMLAVGGMDGWPNGIVQLYDTATWRIVRELPAPGQNVTTLAFSPDGNTLVGSGTDGNIRLWQVSDGALLNTLYYARQANDVAISPDGTLLAIVVCATAGAYGCERGGVVIWQMNDGTMINQFDDLAEGVAFSPDSKILASGSGQNDPLIRLRSVEDWSLLGVLDSSAFSLDFSPDGTLLVSNDFSIVSVWNVAEYGD